jgi:hypothetical protein
MSQVKGHGSGYLLAGANSDGPVHSPHTGPSLFLATFRDQAPQPPTGLQHASWHVMFVGRRQPPCEAELEAWAEVLLKSVVA